MMPAIVEAIDVVAGLSSAPLSLGVATGEIVGLLFPLDRPRAPILRVLAGLDAATAGNIHFPGHRRIAVVDSAQSLSDVLSLEPDLVLLDVASPVADRNLWARIASERAFGTSFVIATASLDQAYRADRVSLTSWDTAQLACAVAEVLRQMISQTQEFLAVKRGARHPRSGSLAGDLLRLNVASRALLAEMGRCALAGDETVAWHAAEGRVAGVCLSDRVLDAAVAEAHER